jgi:arylsulfatase A-like enzyme
MSMSSHAAQPRKPNIIFILADDLGYGDLGCYGQQVIQTSRLNQMAREGMRFTDAYAGSTVCAPSRCCLMTGKDTGHGHIRGNARVPLPVEEKTVAECFKEAGYATGVVGKWGLAEPDTVGVPNRRGFDYWFGYLNQGRAHNYYPDYLWENEQQYWLDGNMDGRKEQYSHTLMTEKGLDFIRANRDDPFFLYMAYTLPHANNELGAETGDGMEVPSHGAYGARDWPSPQKGHAAMISLLDRDCGRILDLLAELGIDDDTLVIFTSDNGPHKEGGADPAFFSSWGPLRGYKRDLYDGGIREPMIARWPGRIQPGSESDLPWAFWDFLPTAGELVGFDSPEGIDGHSIAPAFFGGQAREHEFMYWEFQQRELKQAVRRGNMKAVRLGMTRPTEVYDLEQDIGEKRDLAADEGEFVKWAEDLFANHRTDAPDFPVKDPGYTPVE